MLPYYVPPRTSNATKVRLNKNEKYQLVSPSIPKGVRVISNIIPNLQNMSFDDHDLRRFLELEMKKYMTIVYDTEDVPIHMVPMKWVRGLEKFGLLLSMHVPHLGRTTELNTFVKQLLVCFHYEFLWLDWKISRDVELIASAR